MALDTVKQAKKRANCFATLLQIELHSDVARFTTHESNLSCKNQLLFLAWKEPSKLCSVTPFLWNVGKNLWSLNKSYLLVRKLIWRENMACSHATADLNFIILFELYYTFVLRLLHCKISLITWSFKYAKSYNSFLGTLCSPLYSSEPKSKIKDKTTR